VSNISDLKTLLITEAGSITDTIDKAECLAEIDSWYACRVALDALTSKELSSYSLAGKSITRQQIPILRDEEARHLRAIKDMVQRGGGGGLVDMSDGYGMKQGYS